MLKEKLINKIAQEQNRGRFLNFFTKKGRYSNRRDKEIKAIDHIRQLIKLDNRDLRHLESLIGKVEVKLVNVDEHSEFSESELAKAYTNFEAALTKHEKREGVLDILIKMCLKELFFPDCIN